MNKEEFEIKKIEIEIKEIEQRVRANRMNNPLLKFLLTGIVAGVVFFASWLGIYKEILFKKNTIAIEDARLAHLKHQQIKIENDMNIKAIDEQRANLEIEMNNFKIKNLDYIQQIRELKNNLNKSSAVYKNYEENIRKAEIVNGELESQIQQLKFSGTTWYLDADGYTNGITLLGNGRIDGFGKFNDYWDVVSGELVLYTGADSGKESWTRKWVGNKISTDKVSGIVHVRARNKNYDWFMTKREGLEN